MNDDAIITANNNNNSAGDDAIHHRPPAPVTEAQLRWAQFHHKRTAQTVKAKMERFWLTPASPSQVSGACSDDGNSTTTSSEESIIESGTSSSEKEEKQDELTNNKQTTSAKKTKRKDNKPRISRGRRALLRVSKRTWAARKQTIMEQGYQCRCLGEAATFDEDDDDDDIDNNSDALASIFGQELYWRKKRRQQWKLRRKRRRRSSSSIKGVQLYTNNNNADDDDDDDDEEERIHRFESAFRAMMTSLAAAAAQQQDNHTLTATKRWKRPAGCASSNNNLVLTVDGREYADLKWGVMGGKHHGIRNPNNMMHGAGDFPDRGASWLMHSVVPRSNSSGRSYDPYHQHPSTMMMSSIDEEHAEAGAAGGSPDFLERRRLFEAQANGQQQQQQQQQQPRTAVAVPDDAVGFVQQFVAQMNKAAAVENLISADGKLHKPTFARLIKRYLGSSSMAAASTSGSYMSTPMALASARRSAGSIAARRLQFTNSNDKSAADNDVSKNAIPNDASAVFSPTTTTLLNDSTTTGFVQNFIAQLEGAADEELESLVTDEGKLDTVVFEKLVTRYLARAADQCLEQQQNQQNRSNKRQSTGSFVSPHDLETPRATSYDKLAASSKLASSKLASSFASPSSSTHMSTTSTSPFGEMRKLNAEHHQAAIKKEHPDSNNNDDALADGQPSSSSVGLDVAPGAPTAQPQVHNNNNNLLGADQEDANGSVVSGLAGRLAGSVTGKVGGFMKMFQNNNDTTAEGATAAELQAVADFRKTQNARMDDTSSASSYRVLPDGIKNVVKNFRAFGLNNNNHQYAAQTETVDEDNALLPEQMSFDELQGAASFETMTSYQTTSTASGATLSPERLREFHNRMIQKSQLLGQVDADQTIIDTDGTNSDASGGGMMPPEQANLLMSPAILTKRLHQAIRAVENRNWEQVSYLMSANPWLAEMSDVKSGQYLLHKLAFYGSGEVNIDPETGAVVSIRHEPAPPQVSTDLIRMFSSAVHKFDQDGNLPLHMACASGNLPMVSLLGDRFPGGASVRNEDGMLPLHLAILSCAAPVSALSYNPEHAFGMVKSVLSYFPAALAVTDNEGNLPIHTAASVLAGDDGVDVIFLLLDEADSLVQGSDLRFRNKLTLEEMESLSMETESTAAPTDSSQNFDELVHCDMVMNDRGETPLTCAIQAQAGWEVIEALACGQGGAKAAKCCDANKNTALHLLASSPYTDPDAFLSVLKIAPETASLRNSHGMLPIEIACLQMMPQDIILATVLADLPIDLDRKHDVSIIEGRGASWWYLTCECDDYHVDAVEEIVSVFTYAQSRAMCSLKGTSGDSVLDRATPACRSVLQAALRLVGRFELSGDEPLFVDSVRGLKAFGALDFADPDGEPRQVILQNFSQQQSFEEETCILGSQVSFAFVEEIVCFTVDHDDWDLSTETELGPYFVSIEQPDLTLGGVMNGMLRSEECQVDGEVRSRYASKVFSVLRLIAKALRHLHSLGIVHGNVNLESCCKFDDKWKLADVLRSQHIGAPMRISRLSSSSPPESVEPISNGGRGHQVSFKSDYVCSPSMDCWAFGKLAYEVLVGRDLLQQDTKKLFEDDHRAMMDLLHWSSFNCDEVRQNLRKVGVSDSGASLVALCLSPEPSSRPSLEEILGHNIWKEVRGKRTGVS